MTSVQYFFVKRFYFISVVASKSYHHGPIVGAVSCFLLVITATAFMRRIATRLSTYSSIAVDDLLMRGALVCMTLLSPKKRTTAFSNLQYRADGCSLR